MALQHFVLSGLFVLLTGLAGVPPASAEMLEFPTPQGTKSWPKLPDMPDWHQDQESSLRLGANFVIPDGVDPANADVSIQARGFARRGSGVSVSQLLDSDRAAAPAGAQVRQLADVADKDGTPFNLYVFAPASAGTIRAVAYSEEGEYLLAFTFSARSQAAYDANFPFFVSLIRKYAREIPW